MCKCDRTAIVGVALLQCLANEEFESEIVASYSAEKMCNIKKQRKQDKRQFDELSFS